MYKPKQRTITATSRGSGVDTGETPTYLGDLGGEGRYGGAGTGQVLADVDLLRGGGDAEGALVSWLRWSPFLLHCCKAR